MFASPSQTTVFRRSHTPLQAPSNAMSRTPEVATTLLSNPTPMRVYFLPSSITQFISGALFAAVEIARSSMTNHVWRAIPTAFTFISQLGVGFIVRLTNESLGRIYESAFNSLRRQNAQNNVAPQTPPRKRDENDVE